jgi:hypothetical protein
MDRGILLHHQSSTSCADCWPFTGIIQSTIVLQVTMDRRRARKKVKQQRYDKTLTTHQCVLKCVQGIQAQFLEKYDGGSSKRGHRLSLKDALNCITPKPTQSPGQAPPPPTPSWQATFTHLISEARLPLTCNPILMYYFGCSFKLSIHLH